MKKNNLQPTIFMMDLLATVPYYTAYLSKALLAEGATVKVGSISYYLDPACFSSRNIQLNPGWMDIVGKLQLPRLPRRILKLLESLLNLSALTVQFFIAPPDVIHVQYLPMLKWSLPIDFWFLSFCKKRGAKIVLTVHDLLPHDTGDTHKQTFLDLYSSADGIICHSGHIRTRLCAEFSVPDEKISVIPHGPFFYDLPIDDSSEALSSFDIEPGRILILWQGIVFPYKGLDLLLHAWKNVEAHTDRACLVVAGTGAPEILEEMRSLVKHLGLKQVKLHFRFISSEELVSIYRAADVVVYPYRAITTSGALATALALGKTMVTSDLPVFRELLTNGETALLVDPQNADEMANALLQLIENPALRTKLASNVQSLNFGDESWRSIARKTLQCYQAVLSPTK